MRDEVRSGAPENRVQLAIARRCAALLLCAVSLACGETDPPMGPSPGEGGPGPGTDNLIAALQAAGASVVRAEVLPRSANPFFSVESARLTVNGHNVSVWEYATSTEADAQAALISPDGDEIGNSIVDWIGPPHFYRGSQLIVLYVGREENLLSLLQDVLGPQFAGS